MKHKLEIIFDDRTGKVGLAGPLNNKVLCYGMMELAKHAMATSAFKPSDKPIEEEILVQEADKSGASH